MKTIVKYGKNSLAREFHCWCGCVFMSDEYTKKILKGDGDKKKAECSWLIDKCPCCNEIIKKLEVEEK